MTSERSADYLTGLIHELCKLPTETEWVEFKENRAIAEDIGEYISALSNSAALAGKAYAYLVWGIENVGHKIVGTSFLPREEKVGNEELENWLLKLLSPKINFKFHELSLDGRRLVILEIERAYRQPVSFRNVEYIRVGSYKKQLKTFAEKERSLWRIFDKVPFEDVLAAERISDLEVGELLDFSTYFELTRRALPATLVQIIERLAEDKLVTPCDAGGWNITNLGAILFAKKLSDFGGLQRKACRVIQYAGTSRAKGGKERVGAMGYASAFERLIGYVNGLLPSKEIMGQALRRQESVYPELAIRELIANALIHQDFFITGAGPMIEIFDDRVEITNPGVPLIDTRRFVDTPPRSRNERLASLMRIMGVCEERGSGWDKVVLESEVHQLPAPLAEATDDHTRVVLFGHRPLSKMDKADRIRAVYLHASLRHVNREHTTNSSVRERFGIESQNIATASRLLREAVEAGAIAPYDASAAPKMMRYIPYWAA